MTRDDLHEQSALSRRTFIGILGVVGAAPACLLQPGSPRKTPLATPGLRTEPVVSLHHDLPYLDYGAEAQPYLPPRGLRSAQPLGEFDDATLRTHYYQV